MHYSAGLSGIPALLGSGNINIIEETIKKSYALRDHLSTGSKEKIMPSNNQNTTKILSFSKLPRQILLVFLACAVAAFSIFSAASDINAQSKTPPNPEPILVGDLHEGAASSTPRYMTAIGSSIFFRADDGEFGLEIWRSDPPYDIDHTFRVTDINPGVGSAWPEYLTVLDGILFFQADDGNHGKELWKLEPPYYQAQMVADIQYGSGSSSPSELVTIGNAVLFTADGGKNGTEIWKTQPPYTSAELVADVRSGPTTSHPRDLTTIGWTLFFTADDSTGRELWKSEPPFTQGSTAIVERIFLNGNADPQELTRVGNKLFFTANDFENGKELWISEPPYNEFSTFRANEIDRPFPSMPSDLEVIGDTVFFTANMGTSGFELRKIESPYTSTYVSRVADIFKGSTGPIPNSSFPEQKLAVGETLLFVANDGTHGKELFASAPPYTDAELVKDIYPGAGSADIANMTAMGTTLFFTANDGTFGYELWRSVPPYDPDHTERISDIYRSGNAYPNELFVLGRSLFFNATNPDNGTELWMFSYDWGLPRTGFAPNVVTTLPTQPRERAYQDMNSLTLSIPGNGTALPIVGVPIADDGWNLTWLGSNAGFLSDTAFPTLPGNTAITGHAYLADGTPGPFVNLGSLMWGNEIVLHAWGQRYVYQVRTIQQVAADDMSVLGHKEEDWITLITCKGFDEDSGEYQWRTVVQAVLIRVEPDN
ncbi:MAG: sortase [Anaerolineaceae bacterium]|jgi:LPXTG-site transpeptidase (sortase) family protein|nr:sortase [Anaerolineaceae bacterium]